ncbi:MAG: hypothetical protein NVS1B4_01460 [Gemmatimonadaceae bacterium]
MSSLQKRGFTLIELLVVVVIIGILAAMAIPKFANSKERANVASMKSDLRNMVTAEETYFADYATYTTSVGLTTMTPSRLNVSAGVSIQDGLVTSQGWQATASHSALVATRTCTIWVGNGMQIGTTNEGAPACN